jgi:hypothetical protein
MFRKNSQDDQFGEQRQPDESPVTSGSASSASASGNREPLPAGNGLPELVELMDREGAHVLQLDQHGNEMTAHLDPGEKPERKSVVDTESPWFDAVASLYTAAQASERGPWRRAEIMVSTVREGARTVEIEYTFPDSERQQREAYAQRVEPEREDASAPRPGASDPATTPAGSSVSTGPADSAPTDSAAPAEASDPAEAPAPAEASSDSALAALAADADRRHDEASSPAEAGLAGEAPAREEPTAEDQDPASDEAVYVSSEEPQAPAEEREVLGAPAPEETAEAPAPVDAALDGRAAEAPEASGEPAPAAQSAPASDAPAPEAAPARAGSPEPSADLPASSEAAHAPAGAAAALPDSAPATADHADVAPSYAAPALAAKPSETHLADGNLVLTESAVLQRLGEAQAALFGPGGSARDVSSVLIRVRALGSYYDALTHVRRDGTWEQRRTFELVPEEALHILDLKSDSYLEGSGSPVAMMFRFTPGIPPQVSFDYQDEESFVKYRDRLPAQQYIEELRLFPRTGVNIPEHMNEALTQWSL